MQTLNDCLDPGEGTGDVGLGGGRESKQTSCGLGGSVCTHECPGNPEAERACGVEGPPAGQGGEAGEKAGEGRPCDSFMAGLQSAA